MPLLRIEPMAFKLCNGICTERIDQTGSPATPWRLHHLKTSESKAKCQPIPHEQQPSATTVPVLTFSLSPVLTSHERLALVSFAHVSRLFGLSLLLIQVLSSWPPLCQPDQSSTAIRSILWLWVSRLCPMLDLLVTACHSESKGQTPYMRYMHCKDTYDT